MAVGAVLGVAIWVFSVPLTGRAEPWDADMPIWSLSWLVVAVLGGLAGKLRGVGLPIGYALGQMLITIRSVFVGEFGALGWMFIAGYALAAAFLTLAIVGATALFKRVWHNWNRRSGGA